MIVNQLFIDWRYNLLRSREVTEPAEVYVYLECIPSTRAIYTTAVQNSWLGYVVMAVLTSFGVMVLNSPGAVSLPVTAPSGLLSVCVERSSIGGESPLACSTALPRAPDVATQ